MNTNQELKEQLSGAIQALKAGDVILCPTDTIWGLTCDATNPEAVAKINQLKDRLPGKSLLVLVSHDAMMERFVQQVPEVAWDIIDQASSPVTVIYPGGKNVAEEVLADDGSIGIRIVTKGFCNELIKLFNRPIVSTSANVSGEPTAVEFSQIDDAIIDKVGGVFGTDFDSDLTGRASSIIKLGLGGEVEVIRD